MSMARKATTGMVAQVAGRVEDSNYSIVQGGEHYVYEKLLMGKYVDIFFGPSF